MDQDIKRIRTNLKMTQEEFARQFGVPIKTLRNWEQGVRKPSSWMLDLIIDRAMRLRQEGSSVVDETHGILSYMQIKSKVAEVAAKYDIKKVILFGSYAKGQADETSDVDLYMESDVDGMTYFGAVEDFREKLGKPVDVLSPKTVIAESAVDYEIRDTGVVVYERS